GSHDDCAKPCTLALPPAWRHGDPDAMAALHLAVRYQPLGVAEPHRNRLRLHRALRSAAAADLADFCRDGSRLRLGASDWHAAGGVRRQFTAVQSRALSNS